MTTTLLTILIVLLVFAVGAVYIFYATAKKSKQMRLSNINEKKQNSFDDVIDQTKTVWEKQFPKKEVNQDQKNFLRGQKVIPRRMPEHGEQQSDVFLTVENSSEKQSQSPRDINFAEQINEQLNDDSSINKQTKPQSNINSNELSKEQLKAKAFSLIRDFAKNYPTIAIIKSSEWVDLQKTLEENQLKLSMSEIRDLVIEGKRKEELIQEERCKEARRQQEILNKLSLFIKNFVKSNSMIQNIESSEWVDLQKTLEENQLKLSMSEIKSLVIEEKRKEVKSKQELITEEPRKKSVQGEQHKKLVREEQRKKLVQEEQRKEAEKQQEIQELRRQQEIREEKRKETLKYIELFAKKYGNNATQKDYLQLQTVLANRQIEFSVDELKDVISENVQKLRVEDTRNRILKANPRNLEEFITVFLDLSQPDDEEMQQSFYNLLRDRNLFQDDLSILKTKIKSVAERIELENFEKRLFDESKQIKLEQIDQLDGYKFEDFLKNLFLKMGYQVEQTKLSGDQGADLVTVKFGEKTVIQAKRYGAKVGNKAVQEIMAAISLYRAQKGMVITNNYFTSSAIELARANNIELIDRTELEKLINKHL